MDKQFIKEHFGKHCATNIELIRGEIRGIALYFTGLGHKHYLGNDMAAAPVCAENGILYILPYYNTWCWMNKTTVRYVDTIIDTAIELYGIAPDVPVGIYGGSMGDYNTFHYAIKSKYKIVAADVLCPCCSERDRKMSILLTPFMSCTAMRTTFSAPTSPRRSRTPTIFPPTCAKTRPSTWSKSSRRSPTALPSGSRI